MLPLTLRTPTEASSPAEEVFQALPTRQVDHMTVSHGCAVRHALARCLRGPNAARVGNRATHGGRDARVSDWAATREGANWGLCIEQLWDEYMTRLGDRLMHISGGTVIDRSLEAIEKD